MRKIPAKIKKEIHALVWKEADSANWLRLSDQGKSKHYEKWIDDAAIGGVLSQFVDQKNIRVYLKDSVMKPYSRERTKGVASVYNVLGIPSNEVSRLEWIKPHGRILFDRKCICWGPAKDWKSIVLAVYERAYRNPSSVPYAAVFVGPLGKMAQTGEQKLVEEVAKKLGLKKVVWDDVVRNL